MEDRTKVYFTHLANQFFLCTAFVPRAKLCILPAGLFYSIGRTSYGIKNGTACTVPLYVDYLLWASSILMVISLASCLW